MTVQGRLQRINKLFFLGFCFLKYIKCLERGFSFLPVRVCVSFVFTAFPAVAADHFSVAQLTVSTTAQMAGSITKSFIGRLCIFVRVCALSGCGVFTDQFVLK